jgi:hypothetical protein
MRRSSLGLCTVVTAAVAIGCFGSSNAPQLPDAGETQDSSTPGVDASTPMDAVVDAPSRVDGAAPAPEGGAIGPLSACSAPAAIDSAHMPANFVVATTQGNGKYTVLWDEVGPAMGTLVYKYRFFDGATLHPEQTLANVGTNPGLLAADGLGNAYAAFPLGLAVISPSTGLSGPTAPFTTQLGSLYSMSLAPLRAGGAFILVTRAGDGGNASAYTTRYDPTAATWSTPELREMGMFYAPDMAVNAKGQAVAAWLGAETGGTTALSIATFDGTTWAKPTHTTIGTPAAGQGPDSFSIAAYSNGDALIVYGDYNGGTNRLMKAQRYRTVTGLWDAPDTLLAASGVGPNTAVAIDDADRVTAVYQNYTTENHASANRNLGAGWSTSVDLGAMPALNFTLDPTGDPVVVVNGASGPALRRAAASGSTWDPPVVAGFKMATSNPVMASSVAFDAAGHPVVAQRDTEQALSVVATTICQ